MTSEQEDNFRLRKAEEFLAHCRDTENEARIALNRASDQTRQAKIKYEALFTECEVRAVARRKAGFVATNPGY